MPIFEAPAVYTQEVFLTIISYFFEHLGLKPYIDHHSTDANIIPLTQTPKGYFVRRDRKNRHRVVNVFTREGKKVYSIERASPLNPVWCLREFPSRTEVATIRCGFFSTSVDWHNKQGVQHREVRAESSVGGNFRSFYLNDGSKYQWTKGSKFLEKVSNPGGGDEELRERIAKVRLMRQFKFDFELLVDEDAVDLEYALATAFISMMVQWGYGDITETRGPSFIGET
ncbi:hypothetical protein DASC09_000380 [Saccharomycopsis crataegensis]|uniref:Phospholipid scramblase n=1 Tax=Saccharomycopsis crataegensis TaxID=43959 RepID=A0AAV5QEU6_9ASCO|nr:hypothetical protein DASC09_000380 [Saccharomycopsis crataegensis]